MKRVKTFAHLNYGNRTIIPASILIAFMQLTFFPLKMEQNSEIGTYQQYGRLLKDNPDSLASNSKEGVERVRKSGGNFAFIMESASSELIVNQEPCDILVTSGYLIARPYAIALQKNSTLK